MSYLLQLWVKSGHPNAKDKPPFPAGEWGIITQDFISDVSDAVKTMVGNIDCGGYQIFIGDSFSHATLTCDTQAEIVAASQKLGITEAPSANDDGTYSVTALQF